MHSLTRAAVCLGVLLLLLAPARAATEQPFEQQAFAAAQKAGKPILVDIWASWCPICAKQAPILKELAADPAFKDMAFFKLDFDFDKEVVRAMGAKMQSTLVVFRGQTEVARSVGDTHPDSIKALLEKAIH